MKSIDFYKPLLTGFKLIYSIAIVTCHVAPLSQHLVMNAGQTTYNKAIFEAIFCTDCN